MLLTMEKHLKGSFYVVPKFVVSQLELECGPLRDLYSIIYGFSQDGESGCECNMEYFQRWLLLSESTIRRALQLLEAAELITRVQVGMGRGSYIRYTANLETLDKIQKGVILTPIKRVSNTTEKGVKLTEKGCQIDADTLYKNNIIIYNNISFARTRDTRAMQEEEKKNFITLFFFKNCQLPKLEMEAFVRVNEMSGWVDSKGRPIDTARKRLIWADGWKIQGSVGRVNEYFLECWKAIYNEALRRGDAIADQLLDTRIRCESNKQEVLLTLPAAVREYLEDRIGDSGNIYQTLRSFLQGRRLKYLDLVI